MKHQTCTPQDYRGQKKKKITEVIKTEESHRSSLVGWWSGLYAIHPNPDSIPGQRTDFTSLTGRPRQNKGTLRSCHGREAPKEI